eukprot:CAMPEP_0170476998 /NCGR_PEP_ID=MMETSP0123-20130129/18338_1 /TAXON_ID=182087 /ORGANISM="Favella ehrenbergii, Strain Fehren 1" /LENGTH=117 /DNA_ID=CAMNT_0010748447 /DNA_START=129 /DNA_END=482 /DNA_ORIENTATION=-
MCVMSSVFFNFLLELLREAPVRLEGRILGLLAQTRVPGVKLVEAVAEADALGHSEVADVVSPAALGEASFVQVGQQGEVLLHLRLVAILHAQLGKLSLSLLDSEGSEALSALSSGLT